MQEKKTSYEPHRGEGGEKASLDKRRINEAGEENKIRI